MENYCGMHPNWRALATVHIPLKRFIPEGAIPSPSFSNTKLEKLSNLPQVKGSDIRKFYSQIVEEPATTILTKEEPSLSKKTDISLKKKCAFNKDKFFRYSIENKVDDLQQLQYNRQNIDCTDSYGWTALMMASCEGAIDSVSFLLNLGVNRNQKDKSGNTAYMLAQKKRHWKIMKLLSQKQLTDGKKDKTAVPNQSIIEPFFCELCQQTFKETTKHEHQTSTVHQFHTTSKIHSKLTRFNISSKNRGLQLMVKQGWDEESGLGPTKTGRLYPVKTVIRKQRTGIGIYQDPAKVTHFKPFDLKATKSDYTYKKPRNRNDILREKKREWKKERRLRQELS